MGKLNAQKTEFDWTGNLLGLVIKKGYKVKYLRLEVADREYWVKVPKALRGDVDLAMRPGCHLAVSGWAVRCRKTGKLELEAESIRFADAPKANAADSSGSEKPSSEPVRSAKVLLCMGSDCRKRGGGAALAAFKDSVQESRSVGSLEVRTMGCMKACKHGPNVLVMPDKARYGGVDARQAAAIVARHSSQERARL
ncbi:ferredoxin [Rubidibacter lacunae KORDI 51-2]|uniref:Ferredoxin n=1 Tax=Rubidibacter lacunae KORDI 51-2 TaxID=582515 RepID=U5DN52_9CHRO|nr:(2Fe-2S) ferredoxin domain-containing protein [Rubidibacter lacunae]ERN42292.1 ferredoxin [Rubidibacter lacunae KORDI 51-2]